VAAACDGFIGVEGRVYEWIGATTDDHSFIVIDNLATPLPAQLSAVKDAEVVVEPWTPAERAGITHKDHGTRRSKTDERGYFKTGTTTKPGWYDATIGVVAEGYEPVEHVFRHDRLHHQAIIVLVRRTGSAQQGMDLGERKP
jgi:hypothetical protein